MIENQSEASKVARALRRAEGRKRLMELAANARASTENPGLERLRAYLKDWQATQAKCGPKLGVAKSVLANFMRSRDWQAGDFLEGSDAWAMTVLDAGIGDLQGLPDGDLLAAALRVRWLNEGLSKEAGIKIRVFRHARLVDLSLQAADMLADRAETELLPIVRRRGLPI